MSDLKVEFHPAQLEIYKAIKRFKVVVAGRRFGKSYLAAWIAIIEALKSVEHDVYYVAPTFEQGKRIMWRMLQKLGKDVIQQTYENTAVCVLNNGRRIFICGSDRPDTLRGVSMAYVILDEYADMKPMVWEQIIRPALMDCAGGALFIGTPKGKNHFYDLHEEAKVRDDWEAFSFTSFDNPFLEKKEVEQASDNMSSQSFRQEIEASFEGYESNLFKEDWLKYDTEEPEGGWWFVAVDPAGFENVGAEQANKKKRLDETAIAIVKVGTYGWWVKEIIHGRWDIRETALQILRAAQVVQCKDIGIEAGSLKNAIQPYLEEQMLRTKFYAKVHPLTHGKVNKTSRIVWSLQGRMEKGLIKFNKGKWNRVFLGQMLDFPNKTAHDDLLDALAYIDQIAVIDFAGVFSSDNDYVQDDFILDDISGY